MNLDRIYDLSLNMESVTLDATLNAGTLYLPSDSADRTAETLSMRTPESTAVSIIPLPANDAWRLVRAIPPPACRFWFAVLS